MRRGRKAYYDAFSPFYDRFIALHSRDRQGLARKFLVDQAPLKNGDAVLDLCTGTGTLLPHLQAKVGSEGQVVGVDFSNGMLKVAREKTQSLANVSLVAADAADLPFAAGTFDAVTCSHAFYELKGDTRDRVLQEIVRVLKPNGTFLMMEHDVPASRFVRFLFYIRLASMGTASAVKFLRQEEQVLQAHFADVSKVLAPAGRSKVMICRKDQRFRNNNVPAVPVTAQVESHRDLFE